MSLGNAALIGGMSPWKEELNNLQGFLFACPQKKWERKPLVEILQKLEIDEMLYFNMKFYTFFVLSFSVPSLKFENRYTHNAPQNDALEREFHSFNSEDFRGKSAKQLGSHGGFCAIEISSWWLKKTWWSESSGQIRRIPKHELGGFFGGRGFPDLKPSFGVTSDKGRYSLASIMRNMAKCFEAPNWRQKKNSKGVLSHPYVKMRFLTPNKLYKFPKFSVGVFLGKINVSNRFSGDPLYMHIWMYLHAVDFWCDFAILLIVTIHPAHVSWNVLYMTGGWQHFFHQQ